MFIITQSCCNDASCVRACPVNCIHPTPEEPDFGTSEMLYIDPAGCIDCGACMPACPVGAVEPDYDLSPQYVAYPDLNAQYYLDPEHAEYPAASIVPPTPAAQPRSGALKIAIVGTGPAGTYAAEELLAVRGIQLELDMFDRLPTPLGLIRSGVAPDHPQTKQASVTFSRVSQRRNFRLHLNVALGSDVSLEELRQHYHAVILATGSLAPRELSVPGSELAGVHSAASFAAWYNGHPDYSQLTFDLSHERAVIIGNGNVALDVARILLSDVDTLKRTDIADHALDALANSRVREVVVVGRRGPAQASFSTPELIGLASTQGISIVVSDADLDVGDATRAAFEARPYALELHKADVLRSHAQSSSPGVRQVQMRFRRAPEELLGSTRVTGVRLRGTRLMANDGRIDAEPTDEIETIESGLVFTALGFRGEPIPGVPFDDARGVAVHTLGRVVDSEAEGSGIYVTGWIKRGASGVIGTNKRCAKETVVTLLEDWAAGHLDRELRSEDLVDRLPMRIDLQGWRNIDAAERKAGLTQRRPSVKLTTFDGLLAAAKGTPEG
jgi:ferredoxin--NADP+ reductase